jgi:precorrin-2 dehydrogenase/sirohydrochlorin ferrochelatase
MDVFPAFIPLTGGTIVLAGEGAGLEAKLRLLASSPATLVRLTGADAFQADAYRGARLVFIAGEDEVFAQSAAAAARAAHVLVNVIDRPAWSDFNTPAVIDRGEVVAAVGTGGAAPVMAAMLRTEIEVHVPPGAGRFAALLGRMQGEIRTALPDLTDRRAFLRQAIGGPAAKAAHTDDMASAEILIRDALGQPHQARGRVLFIDASGPADLMTLRAVRALAAADTVAADANAPLGVVDLARREADRLPLDAVASRAAALALSGKIVARVVLGAPDAQELAALEQLGVIVEIMVPAKA